MILGLNFILTLLSLSLVHERLPDRERSGPLPDIVLDNVSEVSWALDVSEVLIMIQTNSCILLIAFHKHRWVVFGSLSKMLLIEPFFQIHCHPSCVPHNLRAVSHAVDHYLCDSPSSAKYHVLLQSEDGCKCHRRRGDYQEGTPLDVRIRVIH